MTCGDSHRKEIDSAGQDETVGREDRIDEIIASYLEGRGMERTPEQVLARYPKFEKELRKYFDNLRDFVELLREEPDRPPHLGDDYEILELIDGGGQARVYKAHQKSLNKVVAIKVPLQASLRSDPEGIRNEAQRAASLRHTHIVPVHHVGEHEGQRFFVMEFIEGQNLAKRIESGPLSAADAAQYVKTIAEALRSNTTVARALANTALLQLRDWARIVEVAAANTTLTELLTKNDRAGLQRFVELVCRGAPGVCASCGVRDSQGYSMARVGDGTPDLSTGTSSQRDYFRGALAHGESVGRQSVHVSKVYVSTVDGLHKFALAAPIRHRSGQSIGVILMSVTTDAALGLVNFPDSHRKVTFIAPIDGFDPNTNVFNQAGRHLILFHPAYRRGGPATNFPPQQPIASYGEPIHAKELDDSDLDLLPVANYEDPVSTYFPDYQGRWIAAFAAVGNTGFFVGVQQRIDDALNVDPFVSWNMAVGIVLVIVVFIAISLALAQRSRRMP